MRKLASVLIAAGGLLVLPVATDAAPQPALNDGVYRASGMPVPDAVQLYIYGGHHWCWYDDAWNGPGWYWCGFGSHRGFGWGGGFGFHGWHGGGAHFSGGGHGDFHGGGHFAGGHGGGGHSSGGHSGGHGGGGHSGGHHH